MGTLASVRLPTSPCSSTEERFPPKEEVQSSNLCWGIEHALFYTVIVMERECKRHGSTEYRNYKSRGWVCLRCEVENVSRRRKVIRDTLLDEAGGKCIRCGYDRCRDALVFHHLDPAQKERGLSNWQYSLKRGRVEASKCILVCANCHAEIH